VAEAAPNGTEMSRLASLPSRRTKRWAGQVGSIELLGGNVVRTITFPASTWR
jgi:hypothetical protein